MNSIAVARPPARYVALLFWAVLASLLLAEGQVGKELIETFWYRAMECVFIVLAVGAWLYIDALERKIKPDNYAVFVAIAPEITIPVYLVRTRGWRGFGRWLLSFLAALCLFVVLLTLIEAITGVFSR